MVNAEQTLHSADDMDGSHHRGTFFLDKRVKLFSFELQNQVYIGNKWFD